MECFTKLFIPSVSIHTETSRSFTDAFFWLQCYYQIHYQNMFVSWHPVVSQEAIQKITKMHIGVSIMQIMQLVMVLEQGCQIHFLEGRSPAEFSSFPALTCKPCVFQISLKDLTNWIRCVQLGLKLNYAGLWPARNWVWHLVFRAC